MIKCKVFFICLLLVVFSIPVNAGTDELEALIEKSLNEAKAAGAQYENDEVGHFYIIDAEYDKIHKDGKVEPYSIQRPMVEPWGCNERPNTVAVTQKFESKQEVTTEHGTEQYAAYAIGQFALDPTPSTEIAGTVVDKRNRPVKNAEVKAENVNKAVPPVVSHSDEQGRYVLKVRSGQYRVTAKSKECDARPQTLWACTWGKVPNNTPAKARFALDLVAECGDMALNISGPYTFSVNIQVEGAYLSGQTNGGKVDGTIPLSLDSDTGEITGEGTLEYAAHGLKSQSGIEELTGLGMANVGSSNKQVKVVGKLDPASGIASLTCMCARLGERTVNGNVTVTDGKEAVIVSADSAQESESCDDPEWDMHFSVPWKVGATYKLDRTFHKKLAEGQITNHEMFDLTLAQKEDHKRDVPLEPKRDSGTGSDLGSGSSAGTQSKETTSGGKAHGMPFMSDDSGLLADRLRNAKSGVMLPPADAEDASAPLDEEGQPIPMDEVPEEYKQLLRQFSH